MKKKSVRNLIVLSTYKISLSNWEKLGLLSREIGYYQLMEALYKIKISFLTYDANDKKFINKYKGIDILFKKYINNFLFSIFAPIIYFNAFLKSDIIKSNQSKGAWTGLIAKILFRNKKLIVRCGWVRTEEMMKKVELKSGFKYYIESFLEKLSFRFSDAIIVTTELDKKYLIKNYKIKSKKINIIPNSVDTKLFERRDSRPWSKKLKITSIGRFVNSKNFESLILACGELNYIEELVLIGGGPLKEKYNEMAKSIKTKITLLSNVDNKIIPNYLENSDIFIMPQKYGSGMSKVIMEAMSLGKLVIASDIPAHKASIKDNVDGFICGKSPESIRDCIEKVVSMGHNKRSVIQENAAEKIINDFSFNKSIEKEFALYNSLFQKHIQL